MSLQLSHPAILDVAEQQAPPSAATLERFREVMDSTSDAIFLVDRASMRYVEFNATACQMLGYTREEMLKVPLDQVGTSTIAELEQSYDAIISGADTSASLETQIRRKDGSLIDVKIHRHLHKSNGRNFIVGVVQDITTHKKSEQALQASEKRFLDMMQNIQLASVMLDLDNRVTFCNQHLLSLSERSAEEVLGQNWFDVFDPVSTDHSQSFTQIPPGSPNCWHRENQLLTKQGDPRLIRWNSSVLHGADGAVTGTASIGEDITDQAHAAVKIQRLNRVYAVLSQINALIVRVSSRDELYKEACRIAVEQGGFRMAMISVMDKSGLKLTPVASFGKDEELMAIVDRILSCPILGPQTMVAQCMRDKITMVSNQSQTDPRLVLSEYYTQAGVASMVVIPIVLADVAVGALALYSTSPDFFHAEEMKLLTELVGDIAFAVDHIEKSEKLNHLSYYDTLTNLANRTLFLDRLAQYMHSATAGSHKLGMYLMDLERFKSINDSLGQSSGDELLRQVASWLSENMGDTNLLARVNADHFAVIVPEIRNESDVARNLETKIAALLDHEFCINGTTLRIAAKVGVAFFPDDGMDADLLFKNAEAALKKAKASGERYLFYTQKMTEAMNSKMTMENQMRQALINDEFVLFYQPKIDIKTSEVTSVEALIRWNSPLLGLVPPNDFIPILEETGLICAVGRWALRQAVSDHLSWRQAGLYAPRIAVNVSPIQLRHRDFLQEIEQVISLDPQAAAGLELEITEGMIMEDIKKSVTSLLSIRAMGVSVAIDDFGTGFSSLSYLAKLPVDTLKIDRSFITDMLSQEGLALVTTIINLAHSLRLNVVAEGVETKEQMALLRRLGCNEMQGYLFSRPVPKDVLEEKYLVFPKQA